MPPALRPWASQLSLFPEDLALHLGPHVARLSAALGSLRPRGETEGGEPQGYDGLTRRGTFDRLLVSEWLWALESPDELVRRAAFGELSFLKPAFRQPQGARRTVVLLDAGPDQLGAPRIAHLALLIVLSRRAEAAGAAFSWGVLQSDPGQGAFSDVTPATLGTWLAARTAELPTEARLAAWRSALSLDAAPEDAWLVGDARLARLPGASGLSRVEVSEVLATDARRLAVRVRPASRAERSVTLDLPPPDTCVRLLRDPFQQTRPPPIASSGRGQVPPLRWFSFSADGHRLLLQRIDGSVGAMAIPHSARATVPKPRRVTPPREQTVLGAGWRYNGGLILLTRNERSGAYGLHGKVRRNAAGKPPEALFTSRDTGVHPTPLLKGQPLGRLLSSVDAFGGERLLLLSYVDESLFLVDEEEGTRRVTLSRVATQVTAAAEVGRKVCFVTRSAPPDAADVAPGAWGVVVDKERVDSRRFGVEGKRAYFAYTDNHDDGVPGVLAVRSEPGLWRMVIASGELDVRVPTEAQVFGAGSCREQPRDFGVLALDKDRRTVWLFSCKRQYKVMVLPGDVEQIQASHGAPLIGWRPKEGGLMLSNLRDGGILFHEPPGAGE
nr:hypothetical protein [Pyxidicoccus fallax]